jgi:hypothetical protein
MEQGTNSGKRFNHIMRREFVYLTIWINPFAVFTTTISIRFIEE